jgi:hypothetical protein
MKFLRGTSYNVHSIGEYLQKYIIGKVIKEGGNSSFFGNNTEKQRYVIKRTKKPQNLQLIKELERFNHQNIVKVMASQ